MADVDEILRQAGARWRAAQVHPEVDVAGIARSAAAARSSDARLADWLGGRSLPALRASSWVLIGVGLLAALLAGLIGIGGASPDTSYLGRTPVTSGISTRVSPTSVQSASIPANCPVTKPDPPFVPPASYLREPRVRDRAWYGSVDLWTDLNVDGEDWSDSYATGQKTFWWSANWAPIAEPMPAITVSGRRIDGPGSFSIGGPGTNASSPDFGTAMLVGVDFPSRGCWEITGRYRGAELSVIVWLGSKTANPSPSP